MRSISTWIKDHQLLAYFFITFLITYGVGFGYVWLAPGKPLKEWSFVWFFEVFGPTFAALLVNAIIGGTSQVKHLLSGLIRWRVNLGWYFAAAFLFLAPFCISLIYKLLGFPAEGPVPGLDLKMAGGIILFTLFSGPVAEELGWRGFALPRLQTRFNALVSSLILGVIWTFWHLPLFFITGASQMSIPFPIYMVLVVTVTLYLTWLYNNTGGSLLITILAHFAYNLTGFLTGVLRWIPPMKFYMIAGPMLGLLTIAIIIFYKPAHFSKKPVVELPFVPSDLQS